MAKKSVKRPNRSRDLVGSQARTVRLGNKTYRTVAVSEPASTTQYTDSLSAGKSRTWLDVHPGERILVLRPV